MVDLRGIPLEYRIGAPAAGLGRIGVLTMAPYSAPAPKLGLRAAYLNLFFEEWESASAEERAKYGPYLQTSGTAKEYKEGQCDPEGLGFQRNLKDQLDRISLDGGFQLVETDNRDAYRNRFVLAAFDRVASAGLRVLCKNPGMSDFDEDSTPLLRHGAVDGAIIERGSVTPAKIDAMRRAAGKPELPVYFVSWGRLGLEWCKNMRAQILSAGFTEMSVSHSPAQEEYASSDVILLPIRGGGSAVPNYRAKVKGGYFSGNPDDERIDPTTGRRIAVSIRMNNPGAVNGASWEERKQGFVATKVTTKGNATTIFETPEDGVDVWWTLMQKYRDQYQTKTVEGIIRRYGGAGQDYSDYVVFVTRQTGFAPNKVIDLNDDKTLLKFAKAMFHNEAGRSTPLSDEQILYGFAQARAAFKGVAAPPPPVAKPAQSAVSAKPTPDEFAAAVARATKRVGGEVFVGARRYNIAYVEGRNPDGTKNANRPDAWDDTRLVYVVLGNGQVKMVKAWDATTEPGMFWTKNRMNPGGAFHIALNKQQTCWRRGVYRDKPALRQYGDIEGSRDDNEDMRRDGDKHVKGDDYGVHHHGGGGEPPEHINRRAAGCQVGRTDEGHAEFMRITDDDERYQADPLFIYSSTVLSADIVGEELAAGRKSGKPTAAIVTSAGGAIGGAWLSAHHLGLPTWAWILAAVVVIAGAAGLLIALRKAQEKKDEEI